MGTGKYGGGSMGRSTRETVKKCGKVPGSMREYAGVCGSMRGRAGGSIQEYVGVCGNAIFDLKSMREYAEAFGWKPANLY